MPTPLGADAHDIESVGLWHRQARTPPKGVLPPEPGPNYLARVHFPGFRLGTRGQEHVNGKEILFMVLHFCRDSRSPAS